MPNHVHVVFAPFLTEAQARESAGKALLRRRSGLLPTTQTDSLRNLGEDSVLAVIMQSLKGYTARKCNAALGKSGGFWQHETFDHVIRDQAEWERTVNYVLNNPVKAGLVKRWQDWKWSYRRQPNSGEKSNVA
jgi:REP element-mobilizing transposase RayT